MASLPFDIEVRGRSRVFPCRAEPLGFGALCKMALKAIHRGLCLSIVGSTFPNIFDVAMENAASCSLGVTEMVV